MTTRKIVLKKVKVGTPIKTVTAGSFGINNLGGVNTSGRTTGSLLAFNQSSGNFEPVTLTGDSNHFLTFDSSGTPDTLQINFTNDSISGSLIPKLDSAFDLGSSTKKWRDLFLSGSTITLGDLTIQSTGGGIEVKDSDGNVLLQNIKFITVNGDTDILAYDSGTSTFTFNDSDIARTDETETFHKNIIVADSANIAGNLTVGGNVSITGDLQYDDVSADSGVFSGSVVIGNNLTADSSTINKIANTTLTGQNATFDSATIGNLAVTNLVISSGDSAFFSKVGVGDLEVDSANIDRLTLDSGQVRQLSTGFINADSAFMDSATISTIATGTINADQQFTDSATITNIANSVLTAKVITNTTLVGDSATIGNVASSQLTIDNATFDSSAHNTLHANALTVDSGDIRQLSVDFINADSAFLDSATITNLSTTQITLSQMTLDSATVNNLNVDSSDIRQFSTEFINFDSAFGDSATITNIANTQLTGSQATLDSATITKLNVDSSDIDHLSTEAINFDSATGDSATITNIANSVLTAKAITGTSADIDSATIGNIAITNAVISSGDSATITNIANSVLTAKAITGTSADIDSATIGNIAATTINVDNINIGDSATFTNIASNSINTNALQVDDLTVDGSTISGTDITFDMSGDITLDVDGSEIFLRDGGTQFGVIYSQDNNLNIKSHLSDQDIVFRGNDNNSEIVSLRLDMSDAGTAIFNHDISLADDGIAKFGTSDDLQIFHDGNNSIIADGGTGALIFRSNNTVVQNAAGDENIAAFTEDGAVKLYFDDSLKLQTKDSGVAITGTLSVDSATLTNLTGDSATITNIASTQFTGSQATIDSADISNLRVTGITNLDSTSATVIDFDNNVLDSSPYQEGRVWYDKKFKSLAYYSDDSDVIHEVGLEEHQKVYNNSGATILKGKPLYFSGNYTAGDVDVPTVGLADATDENAYNAQGLAAADIPNGAYGYCIISGQLSGVDTSALSANTNFFVGLGPGLLQNASPLYPNYPMCLGWVVSSATDGILLVNQQNHSVNSFRVRTSAHVGTNLQVDGDLTVLGSTTSVSSADLTAGTPMFRLNEGNAIGEAGTTFTGTGLDDAFYSGFFTGTANQNYYVRIDGVGTGAGGVDTFEVAFADDSTFSSPVLTKQPITGSAQMIHSTDNISINFASTTGHDSGDRWSGTAGPINVDTGFFSNRNTGSSGIGFTYVGIYYDVSDNKWKLIDEYDSSPSGAINEDDSSYSKGILVLDTLEGNVTGNLTGTVQTANQPNITAVGTLTSLAVANGFSADSGDIRQLSTDFINTDSAFMDSATITSIANDTFTGKVITGTNVSFDSAVFSSAIQTPKIITPSFTLDSNNIFPTSVAGIDISNQSNNAKLGVNMKNNTGNGSLSTDALAVKGDAYFLDYSGGFSIRLIPDNDPVVFKADNRTGAAYAGIDFKLGNGNSALDRTEMKVTTTGLELKGDLSRTSGDMTFDMPANIILDADGGYIKLSDGGTQFGELFNSSSDFVVESKVQDKDIIFKGDDGGSGITALTLDMSEAGKATFNDMVVAPKADIDSADIRQLTTEFIHGDSAVFDSATITTLAVGTLNIDNINIGDSATFTNVAVTTELNTNKLIVDDLTIDGSSIADAGDFTLNIEGDITLDANGGNVKLSDDGLHFGTFSRSVNDLVIKPPVQDGDLVIKGNDGGSEITAMTIDMSEGGRVGIGTSSPTSKLHVKVGTNNNLEIEETGGDLRLLAINDARNANVPMEFAASQFEFLTGDIIANGTVRVGNFNVDSADVITIAKNALSTGSPDALTYDSAAGQFALNANHVMALIQTVDSNGSGLNADTLEGQAGIYYRINVYNASGTLLN